MDVDSWEKECNLQIANRRLKQSKNMKAEPLSKDIYNKAQELGVYSIRLEFSGGNDEGYLETTINTNIPHTRKVLESFEQEVERWAWGVYRYSGAGDGSDYGDNIEYDLENKTVKVSEWYMERKDSEEEETSLEFKS